MKNSEKGIMDLMREDSVLSKKFTYDEFYNQNLAAPVFEEKVTLEEAFESYTNTCEK